MLSNANAIKTILEEAQLADLKEQKGIRANLALIERSRDRVAVVISQENLRDGDVHYT